MPMIESFYEKEFDLNSYLITTYEVQDEAGEIADEGDITLEQDGTFDLPVDDLASGEYTVSITATDIALNESTEEINIEIEEPEPLELALIQTPTDETEGEVTIKVDVNKDNVTTLKWLPGERSVEDFADEGEDIDIDNPQFTVTENGTYTVYAEDEDEQVAVQTITVSNIKEKPEPLEMTLTLTPTDETEGEVTIKVDVNKDNVTTLKWLPGERSVEDFADEGEDIDIDNPQFTVTENGTYTVYAEDEDEQVAVQTITVSNIKEKPEPLEMTLTLTPTDETEGEVTIKVDVNKDNVTTLKWLPGERSAEDFADEGEDIDIDNPQFT